MKTLNNFSYSFHNFYFIIFFAYSIKFPNRVDFPIKFNVFLSINFLFTN